VTTEPWLETLAPDTCAALLRQGSVGRIAVVVNGFPVVLPVNYKLVETVGHVWIAVRTRPGNVIDEGGMHAAFEIDNIDPAAHEGWSVLVRGMLQRIDPDAADVRTRFDPEPWMSAERDVWLFLEPFMITGRKLHAPDSTWTVPLETILGM
jgi:hypothetical protein